MKTWHWLVIGLAAVWVVAHCMKRREIPSAAATGTDAMPANVTA